MSLEIEYFFTPLSGFAYLGHQRFIKLAENYSAKVAFYPVKIASVFEANQSVAPAKQSPSRLAYRQADMKRWGEHLDLPLNLKPKFWPTPDLLAGKCIIAAGKLGMSQAVVAQALMSGVWAKDKNIADLNDVNTLLSDAGLAATEILDHASASDIEQTQENYTKRAIEKGVFGSPTFIIEGELYFGQDRLNFVEAHLART